MIPKFRCFIDGIGIVGVKAIYFDSEQIILEPFNGVENQYISLEEVELMQSTGLFDKNSKEIYEGDILKGPMDFGPAGWIESIASVSYYKVYGYQLHYFLLEHTEILGNKYEHPHLLEE